MALDPDNKAPKPHFGVELTPQPKPKPPPKHKVPPGVDFQPRTLTVASIAYKHQIASVPSRANAILVAVWPFKNKYTYSRGARLDYAMEIVGNKATFIPNLLSASTRESKSNHLSAATVSFKDTEGLDDLITPSDWMAIWMFDNLEDAERVKKDINSNNSANGFNDGLKFLGRVAGVNRDILVDPLGRKTKTVTISGQGFGEFDSKIYFDPAIQMNEDAVLNWMRVQTGWEKAQKSDHFNSSSMISMLINVFMGGGPGRDAVGSPQLPRTNNSQLLVPSVIAKTLGLIDKDSEATRYTYSAMLTTYIGVQQYEYDGFIPNLNEASITNAANGISRRFYTGGYLEGEYGPQVTSWPGVPIWATLQQYLNPAVNEMYTCLHVDPWDHVMPTFVARQIPFTSERFMTGKSTRFLNLPRWEIPIERVIRMNTSRSDSMHINMVHLTNISPVAGPYELAFQRANVRPVLDVNDQWRSGLRPMIQTTNTFPPTTAGSNKTGPAQYWTDLAADRLFGFHLRWSGQIDMKGIQEPICIGDNLQVLDTVYHIEQVTHNMRVDERGGIAFSTSLAVSAGINENGDFEGYSDETGETPSLGNYVSSQGV
jgi:hypothetical protein